MFNKYIEQREGAVRMHLRGPKERLPNPLLRWAFIAAALLFSMAMILAYQATRAEQLAKEIVVRSSYNQIVLRLQQLATARESYMVCMADQKCGVKISFFEEAIRRYGFVEPSGLFFDPKTAQLKGQLRYSGDDFMILPREIAIQLPKDVMSLTRTECPPEAPLLGGFDAEGKAICRAIETSMCEQGNYVTAVDPLTLSVTCAPVGKEISCANGEFISSFAWQGEERVNFTCKARLNPFVAWKFTPTLKFGPALTDQGVQ